LPEEWSLRSSRAVAIGGTDASYSTRANDCGGGPLRRSA
jgi:hypothetical protein